MLSLHPSASVAQNSASHWSRVWGPIFQSSKGCLCYTLAISVVLPIGTEKNTRLPPHSPTLIWKCLIQGSNKQTADASIRLTRNHCPTVRRIPLHHISHIKTSKGSRFSSLEPHSKHHGRHQWRKTRIDKIMNLHLARLKTSTRLQAGQDLKAMRWKNPQLVTKRN